MAHGDLRTITHGRFEGWQGRQIDIASGSSDAELIPAKKGAQIELGEGYLNMDGDGDCYLKNEGGADVYGPIKSLGTGGADVDFSGDEGIKTAKGAALHQSRSANMAISGDLIYRYI